MTALAESLQNRLDVSLAFFYPETCQVCRAEHATAKDGFVGARCRSQVRFIEPPFCERCGLPYPGDFTTPFECANCREMELYFTSARSAVVAHNVVREVIHRYKYQRALWFEPFLTGLFLRKALPALRRQDWDFIVPVPLHRGETPRARIQPGGTTGRTPECRQRNPFELKMAPADQAHGDPDVAHAAAARGEHARSFRGSPGGPAGRRTGDSGGRCFHHRRDHQRVRRGFTGRRGG